MLLKSLLRCGCCTMAAALWLLHYSCCTMAAALWLQHCVRGLGLHLPVAALPVAEEAPCGVHCLWLKWPMALASCRCACYFHARRFCGTSAHTTDGVPQAGSPPHSLYLWACGACGV
jgi:hypothetical protein